MSNPKEKIFIIVSKMEGDTLEKFRNYIENELGKDAFDSKKERIINPKYYIYWYRNWGGDFYIIGTLEDTIWTADNITSSIQKNIKDVQSFFVVDIHDAPRQGLMSGKFWNFLKEVDDLTKYRNDFRRSTKLRKLKSLIDKKEELKSKAETLKQRELELLKKKDIINEEAKLIKKENELKRIEAELDKQQKNLTKLKDNNSEIPLKEEPTQKKKRFFGWL